MSPLVAAGLLLQKGIDPVLHMHCRDSNNIALRSELLGARALGVTSLLIQRGEKLHDDYRPRTKAVYDIGSKSLIAAARQLDGGDASTRFFLGGVITVFNPKSGWRAKSLFAKTDAGVRFLQTQMCFDADVLRRYMARLVELRLTHRAHVVVSLATLPSAEAARWVRDNMRGSAMPEALIARLAQATDPEREGVDICAELLRAMRDIPGIGGVNLLTPGDVATLPAAVHAAGLSAGRATP